MLKAEERPVPMPGQNEILIRVHAAGVNRPDVMQRLGLYPPPKDASDLPGLEVAGEVFSRGEKALKYEVGDKVLALTAGGGYAEFVTVHESNALPLPKGLSIVESAAIPETFFTVYSNIFDRGGLKAGETFLVHGGSSGIGSTAIQLAHAFGARVFTTVGSTEKKKFCEKLGAECAVEYRNEDFVDRIKQLTNGEGINLTLDMVGGKYVEKNWKLAATGGRIVQIANLGGVAENVDFNRLMVKRLTHTGSTLRPRTVEFKADIASKLYEKVWPLLENGTVKPIIDSEFSYLDAAQAHTRMESSNHMGKIVLTMVGD